MYVCIVCMQVSNWFANARRRLKRTVVDPRLTWAGRIRLYDRFVVGKQEPLDVSSADDDDDDDDDSDVTGGQIFAVGQLLNIPYHNNPNKILQLDIHQELLP